MQSLTLPCKSFHGYYITYHEDFLRILRVTFNYKPYNYPVIPDFKSALIPAVLSEDLRSLDQFLLGTANQEAEITCLSLILYTSSLATNPVSKHCR